MARAKAPYVMPARLLQAYRQVKFAAASGSPEPL
jgi:hypothetical protein